MPLFKCRDCHHEWEGIRATCDWCFTPAAKILQQKTNLEQCIEDTLKHGIRRKAAK